MRPHFRRRPEHDPASPRDDRRERGATLVEYALLVALLAVPTVGAIEYVQGGAETKVDQTAEGISTHTIPSIPPSSDGGGGGSDTTTTTSTTSTTTTTQPPATTTTKPPTTTTTQPPTTTTKPPTTTTKPPTTTTTAAPTTTTTTTTTPPTPGMTWGSTSKRTSGSTWALRSTVTIKYGGQIVAGAEVTVSVTYVDRWGTTRSDGTLVGTTNQNGQVQFTSDYFSTSSSSNSTASKITFTVTKVTKSGVTWSGSGAAVSLNR